MQGILQQAAGNGGGAQETWRRGLQFNLAPVALAQRFGQTLRTEQDAAELDAVIARYKRVLGTSDPVLDLVVGSAVAKGDMAAAEVAAASCVNYDGGSLYPSCMLFLGYDPMNKETPPQTPEGQKAFAGKSFEKLWNQITSISDIFS
jgi:hypothetical protein